MMLSVIEYFKSERKQHWLEEIRKSDWRAGTYLSEVLLKNEFFDKYGERARVLLLVQGDALMGFCTYAERDEIDAPELKPWVGFVYTFPQYRGARRMGKLLEYAYALAKSEGHPYLYLSSGEEGLYEKYGFAFWKDMKEIWGDEETHVFRKAIEKKDYSDVLGMTVSGRIDRPLGTTHPNCPDMLYTINYGYVEGILAADGEEQDVYVFGTEEPIGTFSGKVIGVIHRLNDCEDKWIVSIDGADPSRQEILDRTEFQEQFYMGELYS